MGGGIGGSLGRITTKANFFYDKQGFERGFGVLQSTCGIYIQLYLSDYIEFEVLLHTVFGWISGILTPFV